jgi:TatD DNase family protein
MEEKSAMIDTHCHLELEPLYSCLDTVIADARSAGVTAYVMPGVHPDGWQRMTAIAAGYPEAQPAYGIHPMHAGCLNDATLEQLALIAANGVALGEIGLDPNYCVSMEQQEQAFRKQLRLAVSAGLPVLIHCRRAFQRTLQVLREEKAQLVGGIMHAFSGSPEMAREFIRLGFAISISAVITRPNALKLHRLVREMPLEHLVVETDAPDLAPQRYCGQPNQPAWLVETINSIAAIKEILPEVVAAVCTENSRKILQL